MLLNLQACKKMTVSDIKKEKKRSRFEVNCSETYFVINKQLRV